MILSGEKKLLPKAEVKWVDVGHYPEISVKSLYTEFAERERRSNRTFHPRSIRVDSATSNTSGMSLVPNVTQNWKLSLTMQTNSAMN